MVCLIVWVICGVGCRASPAPQEQTVAFSRIVELSHLLTPELPQPPDVPRTQITFAHTPGETAVLPLHLPSTTYLSIPAAGDGHPTIDQMSPRELLMPAVVLDVRTEVRDDPNYQVSVPELRAWEQRHGRIPADGMVLLLTGWDQYWNQPAAYLNLDVNQVSRVPGFSAAAVTFLMQKRGVAGLGADTPAVIGTEYRHSASGEPAPRLVLENLTRIDQLPPTGTTLVLNGLKLQAGTGSPVHVLAFVP